MSPSTDATPEELDFARNVLRRVLERIEDKNREGGRYRFLVSHAWTAGATMYLVYTAPPSDITWGLVRDTRQSIISPSSWNDVEEAALHYYLLDFEEDWPGPLSRQPDEPDTIQWSGHEHDDLPELVADIPDSHRYSPTAPPPATAHLPADVSEPRRYADPM